MAIPAWKLQLQQNISKKKTDKVRQDEQRRIQLLPPWKRAAIEQQTQSKNVIIIPNINSTSLKKSTSTVSSTSSNTVVTSPRYTNSINSVNSKSKPNKTVSIIPANQKSPIHNNINTKSSANTITSNSSSPNHVLLKNIGKSSSFDFVDGGKLSNSNDHVHDHNNLFDHVGVSDEHCISVHNNPFLRQEKNRGITKTGTTSVTQAGLGNCQKVHDSTSPIASKATTPCVARNHNIQPNETFATDAEGTSALTGHTSNTISSNSNVINNNFIIDKQQTTLSPDPPQKSNCSSNKTGITTDKRKELAKEKESQRASRSTGRERKISVTEMLSRFGRAASHDEKNKVRKLSSNEIEDKSNSPRSKSNIRADYGRVRERSPSPVRNRYRPGPNAKPRPKSSPIEIPKSVILSCGRSPPSSPKPVRATVANANKGKAPAPKVPITSSSSNKIVINASSNKQKASTVSDKSLSQKQKAPAPTITISDNLSSGKPSLGVINNGTPGRVVLLSRKNLLVNENSDAGRTPPARRKPPLPASAIIDLSTAGPIQEASGKPPTDPEQIVKDKSVTSIKNDRTYIENGDNLTKPTDKSKSDTVSLLTGSLGNKRKAPSAPAVKVDGNVDAIPYPKDFRRPKSWQENQQKEKTLPVLVNLKQTKPVNSDSQQTLDKNSNISHSSVNKPESLSPVPKSLTLSPIPTKVENISLIPKSEKLSSPTPQTVILQNGDLDAKEEDPKAINKKYSGEASQDMMEKARALKKVKKKVNYEVIGGNAPTGKPSAQASKSGRNRDKSKLKISFSGEPDEFEYQSEQSLLAEYGDVEEEEQRRMSVSEDEEVISPPASFKENVLKGTGGLQSYTPSYLRDLTPSMMREQQEAARRKEVMARKQAESGPPAPYHAEDVFSSSSAAMLF